MKVYLLLIPFVIKLFCKCSFYLACRTLGLHGGVVKRVVGKYRFNEISQYFIGQYLNALFFNFLIIYKKHVV